MRHQIYYLVLLAGLFASPLIGQQYYYNGNTATSPRVEVGDAVYYADYLHGRITALGEVYRKEAYTAAHRTYPKGTLLKVTRMDNGRSVVVRVNDRGPYDNTILIDVSKAAAIDLDLLKAGRARVTVEPVGQSEVNPGERPAAAPQSYNQPPPPANTVYYTVPESRTPPQQGTLTAKGGNGFWAKRKARRSDVPVSYDASMAARSPAAGSAPTVNSLAAGVTGYAIQLASYQNMDNASRHVLDLQGKGLNDVYLLQRGGFNKVVIAAFPTQIAAKQYLVQFRQQYQMDGLVVRL